MSEIKEHGNEIEKVNDRSNGIREQLVGVMNRRIVVHTNSGIYDCHYRYISDSNGRITIIRSDTRIGVEEIISGEYDSIQAIQYIYNGDEFLFTIIDLGDISDIFTGNRGREINLIKGQHYFILTRMNQYKQVCDSDGNIIISFDGNSSIEITQYLFDGFEKKLFFIITDENGNKSVFDLKGTLIICGDFAEIIVDKNNFVATCVNGEKITYNSIGIEIRNKD